MIRFVLRSYHLSLKATLKAMEIFGDKPRHMVALFPRLDKSDKAFEQAPVAQATSRAALQVASFVRL